MLCTLLKHLWQQLLHMMQRALYARMHTYFGAEPLKLHVAGWGTAVHSHFQISQEMFNQIQVRALVLIGHSQSGLEATPLLS